MATDKLFARCAGSKESRERESGGREREREIRARQSLHCQKGCFPTAVILMRNLQADASGAKVRACCSFSEARTALLFSACSATCGTTTDARDRSTAPTKPVIVTADTFEHESVPY